MRLAHVGLLCVLVNLSASSAFATDAQVPMLLGHQGRLLDGTDQPVNAQIGMTFSLYATSDSTITTPLWTDSQQVTVGNGLYAVVLGDVERGGKALDPSVFAHPEVYLSVSIGSVELLPRLRVPSAPYALRAAVAAQAESVVDGSIGTNALADNSVTLAKLSLTNGKFVGLDADTLDGLDSSAFAPADIVGTVDAIKASTDGLGAMKTELDGVQGDTTSLLADTATLKTNTASLLSDTGDLKGDASALMTDTSTLKADTSALKSDTATLKSDTATLKSDTSTLKADTSTLKSDTSTLKGDTSGLKSDTAALMSDTSTLKADTATLKGQLGAYSKDCHDFAAKGWASADACLQDGRWHMYFNLTQGSVNKVGATPSWGSAGITAFYVASQQGADTKIRMGEDWYNIAVRAVNDPSSFWCFISDRAKLASFVVRSNGTITDVNVNVASGTTQDSYNDSWRTSDLGNRHLLQYYYTGLGNFSDLNQNGGVDFWARF